MVEGCLGQHQPGPMEGGHGGLSPKAVAQKEGDMAQPQPGPVCVRGSKRILALWEDGGAAWPQPNGLKGRGHGLALISLCKGRVMA